MPNRPFIHSVVRQNVAVGAAAVTNTFDLPVGPLSFIVLTLRFLNNGANTLPTLFNLLAQLTNVSILFRGQAIVSMNGRDLFAYNLLFAKFHPPVHNRINTDNGAISITMLVPFSRRQYDVNECFPRVARGELQMQLQWAADANNIDTKLEQVETVELPDATPSSYVKATTLTHTPAATGQSDLQVPIGTTVLGFLIFSTTVPTTTAYTTSANQVRILANNRETQYALTNWDSLRGLNGRQGIPPCGWASHIHMENTGGAYTQNADTVGAETAVAELDNHALLCLDPTGDGTFAIDTRDLADLKIRFDAGDTNAIRVIPVEMIAVAGAVRR